MLQTTNIINEVKDQAFKISEAQYYIKNYNTDKLTDFLQVLFRRIENNLLLVVKSLEEIAQIELVHDKSKDKETKLELNSQILSRIDNVYHNLFRAKRGLKELKVDGLDQYNRTEKAYEFYSAAEKELEEVFYDSIEPFVNLRTIVLNPDLNLIESTNDNDELKEQHLAALQESLRAILNLTTEPTSNTAKRYIKSLYRHSRDLSHDSDLIFLDYQNLRTQDKIKDLNKKEHFKDLMLRYNGIVAELPGKEALSAVEICAKISYQGKEYKDWLNDLIDQIPQLISEPEYIVDLIEFILLIDRVSHYDAQEFRDLVRSSKSDDLLTAIDDSTLDNFQCDYNATTKTRVYKFLKKEPQEKS